jgi:hypothetical protein
MRFLLLLIFVSSVGLLNAQANWYKKSMRGQKTESFIITLEGDTIPGMLEFDTPYRMARRISFFTEGSDEAERYSGNDIKGFAIYGKFWISRRIQVSDLDLFGGISRRVDAFLLPVVEDGPIKLYLHYINDSFMDLDGNLIPAYSYVLFKGEKGYAYLRGDEDWLYDNKVWYLLNDSKDIVAGIQSEEYAWDDLITLIKRYNYFKSQEEEE